MPRFAVPRPQKLSPLERREALWGLLFISPWLIGFVAVHVPADRSPR